MAEPIVLSPDERVTIFTWAHGRRFPLRLVQRARIIQMAADGILSQRIPRKLSISRPTVQRWRQRFLAPRCAGLEQDAPRPMPRHRHQEFIRFLKKIDVDTLAGLEVHLIVDNYGTHKHLRVTRWLQRHPRFQRHFIPTSSSWLNVVGDGSESSPTSASVAALSRVSRN